MNTNLLNMNMTLSNVFTKLHLNLVPESLDLPWLRVGYVLSRTESRGDRTRSCDGRGLLREGAVGVSLPPVLTSGHTPNGDNFT